MFSVPSAPVTQSGNGSQESQSPPLQYNNGDSPDKENMSPIKQTPSPSKGIVTRLIIFSYEPYDLYVIF